MLVSGFLIAVLLLVGVPGVGSSFHASTVLSHGPTHTALLASQALMDEARASAARGEGPGKAVPAPPAHPTAGPNVSFGVVMTYDAYDGYVVAVSLNDSYGPANNTYGPTELTWEFAGAGWSLLNTTGTVPATLAPGLVYDGRDQYVLLYGGRLMDTAASFAPLTNQTFSYRAGVWTNLSASSTAAPFAVDFPNLVYDAANDYVVLYDEVGVLASNGSQTLETTWSYAGGVWTDLTAKAGTPPAFFGQMAYDAADGYVVYFGGFTLANQLTNATFTFVNGTWTNATASVLGAPSGRMYYGLTYNNALREVLLYGGLDQQFVWNASAYSTETWAYAGGNWTRLSTNGTSYNTQSMVYDAATNQTLLLGSSNFTVVPPNVVTWNYSNGSWTILAPALAPSAPVADAGQSVILTVILSPNAGGLSYRYAGLPAGCASVNAPRLTCVPMVTGTYVVRVSIAGAEGFSATASATITVNSAPSVIQFGPTAPVGEVGIPVGISVSARAGSGALAYSYLGLPGGCVSANAPQIRCTPGASGNFDLTVKVTDAVGMSALATAQLPVVAALAVYSLGVDRTVVDVGQTVAVDSTLVGGVGPFDYRYSGLPAGCTAVNASSFACQPSAVGVFSLRLDATDTLGATGRGATSLTVNPLPTISSLEISNPVFVAGGSTQISTPVAGGTAPFRYTYAGLPAGCAGSSAPVITCTNVSSGNYTVKVTVVDATGASVSATGEFAVQPRTTGPIHPTVPLAGSGGPGFWWGLAIGAVAIVLAGVAGAYRLVLARQGREIVRRVRMGQGDSPAEQESPPSKSEADGARTG